MLELIISKNEEKEKIALVENGNLIEYYEEDEFLNIENILNPSSKELKKIKE